MGIGSAAVPGVHIGKWSTIGAGGVVIENVPANSVAVGVPAKVQPASASR
jgi:UDP-N-acetylbacillosamine N-acetyltransferase